MCEGGKKMEKREFNLLEEPWIKIMTRSLEQKEVSLVDALVHAQDYRDLSGETPTQDAAILRVLLAAAITCFYRYDADGEEEELSEESGFDERDVWERWEAYWERGRFPESAIRKELKTYEERFWLFHPETPFWQVKDLQYGTDYGVESLFGNMKESNNKKTRHHFSMTDGEEVEHLRYGEAVRWLVHLNAYAVNVKQDEKAPGTRKPVGVGRLGQLGFVMVNGDDLFRILMLNLCALDRNGDLWGEPRPVWEQAVCEEQGREIGTPDNLPERYTLLSRRVSLKRDSDGNITGFRAMGGDFFSVENDFGEPMTIWEQKRVDKKTGEVLPLRPQRHNPAIHAWREFPTLFNTKGEGAGGSVLPGVVQWVNRLYREKILRPDSWITFRMIGLEYGDGMSYTYGDCIRDTLTISAELLNDLNHTDRVWITRVSDQIEKCRSVTEKFKAFADKVSQLLYGTNSHKNEIWDCLTRQYYSRIDHPFREWLIGIDPTQEKREEKILEWERQSLHYASKTVEDYIATLGTNFYLCREEDGKSKKRRLLSVPMILNEFRADIKKVYNMTGQLPQRGEK